VALKVELTRSDGVTMVGELSADCHTITWADTAEGVWINLNYNIENVHVVHMTHFDVG
jgi:hypothetical protein